MFLFILISIGAFAFGFTRTRVGPKGAGIARAKVLSREITSEWKGGMQVAILL